MRVCVLPLVEALEVREDFLLTAEGLPPIRKEDRDLVGSCTALEVHPLVGIRGHLADRVVQAELGEPLPDLVRMRTPFRLVELHAPSVPARSVRETDLNPQFE